MSGHHPEVYGSGHGAWCCCECGWRSGVVQGRGSLRSTAAASYAWACHIAERVGRRR